MQAGLGLVQDHQRRRPRRQQRRHQQEIAQRSVRQLRRLQRPQQPVLQHLDFEITVAHRDIDRAAGKGIRHGGFEFALDPDLLDGREGGGEIGTVAGEYRRARADLPAAGRCVDVGAEVVIETPVAQLLAQRQQLGAILGIGAMGEHAVERLEVRIGLPALPLAIAQGDRGTEPLGEGVGALQDQPGPESFRLDHGIAAEQAARDRQAEVDRIAVCLGREAQLQADRRLAHSALHGLLSALHAVRELLGPRPQHGRNAAFERERRDDAALRDIGQQPQRAIEARLAAAVGAGHDGQRLDLQPHVAQRAIA